MVYPLARTVSGVRKRRPPFVRHRMEGEEASTSTETMSSNWMRRDHSSPTTSTSEREYDTRAIALRTAIHGPRASTTTTKPIDSPEDPVKTTQVASASSPKIGTILTRRHAQPGRNVCGPAGAFAVALVPTDSTPMPEDYPPRTLQRALLKRMKAKQAADRMRAGSTWRDSDFVVVDELGDPLAPPVLESFGPDCSNH